MRVWSFAVNLIAHTKKTYVYIECLFFKETNDNESNALCSLKWIESFQTKRMYLVVRFIYSFFFWTYDCIHSECELDWQIQYRHCTQSYKYSYCIWSITMHFYRRKISLHTIHYVLFTRWNEKEKIQQKQNCKK